VSFLDEGHPSLWTLTTGDDDFAWNDHAWQLLDGNRLRPGIDKRGDNEQVAGVAGRRALRKLPDEVTELLTVLFKSTCDPDGDPVTSAFEDQLQANFDAFLAGVDHTARQVDATLTGPGRSYAGGLQVVKAKLGDGIFEATAAVTVVLPRPLELVVEP